MGGEFNAVSAQRLQNMAAKTLHSIPKGRRSVGPQTFSIESLLHHSFWAHVEPKAAPRRPK